MGRYRKKPVVIDAALYDGQLVGEPEGAGKAIPRTCPPWFPPFAREAGIGSEAAPGEVLIVGDDLVIGTLEGSLRASPGDFIIRGVKGEIYPCKPDIFHATYDALSD